MTYLYSRANTILIGAEKEEKIASGYTRNITRLIGQFAALLGDLVLELETHKGAGIVENHNPPSTIVAARGKGHSAT